MKLRDFVPLILIFLMFLKYPNARHGMLLMFLMLLSAALLILFISKIIIKIKGR